MYSRDEALEIVETALGLSDADETEVIVSGGRLAETRFADNEILRSTDESRPLVRVRAMWSRRGIARQGVATTHATDRAGLRDAIGRARELAAGAPPDPSWRSMAAPGFYESNPAAVPGALDEALVAADPIWRTNEVARVLFRGRRYEGLALSGRLSVSDGAPRPGGDPGAIAIGNTWGVRLHHRASTLAFELLADNGRGNTAWAGATANRRGAFDVEQIAAACIERALLAAARVELAPGPHRVLLEPAAVAALLEATLPAFSRRAVDEARSYLSHRVRLQLAVPWLSLVVDPADPDLVPCPFDGEGVPSRRIVLIEEGVARDVGVERDGPGGEAAANGFGPIQPSGADASPTYARLLGGTGSVDELAARHPDTTLIARLADNRLASARALRVTGTTRDGFYTRRDGQLNDALVDMVYQVGVFDVLQHVVDASEPVRVGDLMVPALVVEDFALSHSTGGP